MTTLPFEIPCFESSPAGREDLHRYLGPADSLCRVMAGDVIDRDDFLRDSSPYVYTWIFVGIFDRMVRMMKPR